MKKDENTKNSWWHEKGKVGRVIFFISCIFTALVLAFFAFLFSTRELGLTSVSNTLFGEGMSGWAWLTVRAMDVGISLLLTFFTAAVAFVVSFLLNSLIGAITWKGKRSKTVGSLIRSLVRYIVVIIAIGIILSFWGVDIQSIVAGLGIVTLIIGLGCQSLIADIVAGIFVVFDDFFDVGDIVVVDGFRATVTEIGLRSTKFTDWAGNIKSINNAQITTVVNLSRIATTIGVPFVIDREEDIERVEAIFFDNLDKIAESLPMIIGKIAYRGVNSLTENGIELLFHVKCEETDRFQVNRDVLREFYLLMRRNGVRVPFSQIYVHEEPERETAKATPEDKAKAEEFVAPMREVPDDSYHKKQNKN